MNSNRHYTGSAPAFSSRPYETGHDFQQMRELLMEGRSRTNVWRYWHSGELAWGYFMLLCHLNPQEHIRLWHDAEGKLAGYAMLSEDPSIDFQVLPEYEWAGIETEAMAWMERRLAELRRRDAQCWGGALTCNVRQDDARRIAFLEQHGFRPGEYIEVNMLRALDTPIADATLPAGCQVRAVAGAGDITNRAGAQREVWHPWSVGKVSDEDYACLMQQPGYQSELDVVAIAPDGVMAGYVNCWTDPVILIGDFGPVGTRSAYRRQGFARAALLEGLRRLQAHGMARVSVSTGESNMPARRLYESIGFAVDNRCLTYTKPE